MRALVQRVRFARVTVGPDVVGEIGPGVCVLLGVAEEDSDDEARRLARRVASLRIFENEEGRLDRSVLDAGGAALVVSQFTLIADTRKANRPSFAGRSSPDRARNPVHGLLRPLRLEGVADVQTGAFGAWMLVEIGNDGPVTVLLDDLSRCHDRGTCCPVACYPERSHLTLWELGVGATAPAFCERRRPLALGIDEDADP